MARRLSLASTIAEATSDPLVVELKPGTEIEIMPPSAVGADRLDRMLGFVEEYEALLDGDDIDVRHVMRAASLILPMVMSEDDYQTWVLMDPPLPAFKALLEAVNDFYTPAGTPGEGPASEG